MDLIVLAILPLLAASWIYWLLAAALVHRFFRQRQGPDRPFSPPVSILKPVRGLDAQAYHNFASFCRQQYPRFEILFGVAAPDDPAIGIIERLQKDFPRQSIRVVLCPGEGANGKAVILHRLTTEARYHFFVISDSDMRVEPDYIRRVVAPLRDHKTGLVTCPYRGTAPITLTAKLESLYMGVTFIPHVIAARTLRGMHFALGATVALRRRDLEAIGGFAAISDYLADDYQLGRRIADRALAVHLSDYVVDCYLGGTSFRDQWQREVRWSRCIRMSRPLEYPGLLLTFSTPLALILAGATGFGAAGLVCLGGTLALRWAAAWRIGEAAGDREIGRWLPWLPVRDLLSALVWCAGAFGKRVTWRGKVYKLRPRGRMETLSTGQHRIVGPGSVLRLLIRRLDRFLLGRQDIREFSPREECLLRLSVGRSSRPVVLADGTSIAPGEPVGDLHWWNEHMPPMKTGRPDLRWARDFQRRLKSTMQELATYVAQDPAWREVKGFRGNNSFGGRQGQIAIPDLFRRWGFELHAAERPPGLLNRFIDFWEGVYVLLLIWTYSSTRLGTRSIREIKGGEIWISTLTLFERYGKWPATVTAPALAENSKQALSSRPM